MPTTSRISRNDLGPAGPARGEARSPVAAGSVVASKYQIGGVVGLRGTGIVCEAVHLDLGTKVEVTFAHPEDARNENAVARFLSGARSAAQLRSQHARRVLDCGSLPAGQAYMVLESLEGADLRGIVATHGSLPVEEALSLVLQACEALGEAHARGLVHDDLRLENLLLTRGPDGGALIKVLGLEFATDAHHQPAVDPRADVWSLGVVLFELLTGASPFGTEPKSQSRPSLMPERPPSPRDLDATISNGLSEVVRRCLETNADIRFSDAMTLARALRAFGGTMSSMSAERVEDVLGHTKSILPPAELSSSPASVRPSRSISGTLAAPLVPWDMDVSDEFSRESEEAVRESWLMDEPQPPAVAEPTPAPAPARGSVTPPRVTTTPPPIPRTTTTPPPIPRTTTPPPMPAVTSAPPTPTVTTPPPMPASAPPAPAMASVPATPRSLPARSTTGRTVPPPLPSSLPVPPPRAPLSALFVKHQRALTAAAGGAVLGFLGYLIVLVSTGEPSDPTPPIVLSAAPALPAVVAPAKAQPSASAPAPPAVAASAPPRASAPTVPVEPTPRVEPAPRPSAPPREPAANAAPPPVAPRPKRPAQSNLYPVLKPPDL